MKKNIAGVSFTETGILIEKKYNDVSVERKLNSEFFTGKFLELAKRLAKYRMHHCYKQLHNNLARAVRVTQREIVWQGGHFQVPVWESLERILELKDARDLDPLQAQQILRSILFHCSSWAYDIDIVTGERIDEKDMHIDEDFKNFITEQILVAKWNLEVNQ
jgi:hypothetical protein